MKKDRVVKRVGVGALVLLLLLNFIVPGRVSLAEGEAIPPPADVQAADEVAGEVGMPQEDGDAAPAEAPGVPAQEAPAESEAGETPVAAEGTPVGADEAEIAPLGGPLPDLGGPVEMAERNGVVTHIYLTKEDGTAFGDPAEVSAYQRFRVNVRFSLPDGQINAGDTTEIRLPNTLEFPFDETFEIRDSEGRLVANAVADKMRKTLTLTYTDVPSQQNNVNGELFFLARVDLSVVTSPQTLNPVFTSGIQSIPTGPLEYTGFPSGQPRNLTKGGWRDPADPRSLIYNININQSNVLMQNAYITDEITTAGVTYNQASLRVEKGSWSYQNNAWVLSGAQNVTSSHTPVFATTPGGNPGFRIELGTLNPGEGIRISYKVNINYSPSNGEIFKNQALLRPTNIPGNWAYATVNYQQSGGGTGGYVYKIRVLKQDQDGAALAGAKFNVVRVANNVVIGTITTGADGRGELGGLLKADYRLVETDAPAGYFPLTSPISVAADDFGADLLAQKTVENRSIKLSITGTKIWEGGASPRPAIQLQLFKNDVAEGAPVTLPDGTTTHTWSDLDRVDANGVDYVYTVDEVAVPANYEKSNPDGLTVKNTYRSPKINITGTKIWEGGPSPRPTIRLQLYRSGVAEGAPVTLPDGTTTHTWTNLDKTNAAGVDYVYTVDEVAPPANYDKTNPDGLTVKNTYRSPKIDVTGTKVWEGGPSPRPTIRLQLYRNGVAEGAPVELADGTITHTWTDLDKTDTAGVDYVYTVDEVAPPANYDKTNPDGLTVKNTYRSPKINVTGTKVWEGGPSPRPTIRLQLYKDGVAEGAPVELVDGTITYTWADLDKTDTDGVDYVYTVDELATPANYEKSNPDAVTVKNTYRSPKINVTGTKVWEGGPSPRPTIRLQLYRNGVAEGAPVELADGTTTHTWTNLDKTNAAGVDYVYTVDEVAPPANYEKSNPDAVTVKNTYKSPKINVTGTKVWEGGPSPRPTIRLQLYRNGAPLGAPVELADGTTTYTWTNLDKTDGAGVDYVYTVDEVDVPENYTKSNPDALTVKNTYGSPKIEITGKKLWEGGASPRPTVKLQLYKNGAAEGAPVELPDGTTTYTWTNLDKTDASGVDYVYMVDELDVPANYGKSNPDALTVKNTYGSPKIDVVGKKLWEGGATPRPTIRLQLYKDGVAEGAPVELKDGVSHYVWKDLDKTDADGKNHVYTVNELEVPEGYVKSHVDTLTVKNTYVPEKTEVTGKKLWEGGSGPRPTIKLQLFRDGEKLGDPVELKDGVTAYTWKDLDKTDRDGKAYVYTVDEVEVPSGYKKSNPDGLTVKNTQLPPSVPRTGEAVGGGLAALGLLGLGALLMLLKKRRGRA